MKDKGEGDMLKKVKKIFTVILALSIIMSMLCGTAFAEINGQGSTSGAGGDSPYVYYYNGYDVNVSPHYLYDESYGTNSWLMIFRLDKENYRAGKENYDWNEKDRIKNGIAVYCCDVETNLVSTSSAVVPYKRVNLEDSSYYDETTAAKIRGIFEHGYWPCDNWNTEAGRNKVTKWFSDTTEKVNA